MAENPANGNYSMRTLQAELGGMLNLEKRPVRGADPKASENVVTNTLLLDARGRQDEPEPKKGATARPSEPVELLFLRGDLERPQVAQDGWQVCHFSNSPCRQTDTARLARRGGPPAARQAGLPGAGNRFELRQAAYWTKSG